MIIITFSAIFRIRSASTSATLISFKVMSSQERLNYGIFLSVALGCCQHIPTVNQAANTKIDHFNGISVFALVLNANSCYKWIRPSSGILSPSNVTKIGFEATAVVFVFRCWKNGPIIAFVFCTLCSFNIIIIISIRLINFV